MTPTHSPSLPVGVVVGSSDGDGGVGRCGQRCLCVCIKEKACPLLWIRGALLRTRRKTTGENEVVFHSVSHTCWAGELSAQGKVFVFLSFRSHFSNQRELLTFGKQEVEIAILRLAQGRLPVACGSWGSNPVVSGTP